MIKVNKIKKCLILLLAISSTIIPSMGNGIYKNTNLGPFYGSHEYYIHLYNIDDIETISINGKTVATAPINNDKSIDITTYLKDGNNIINLIDENTQVRWARI